MNELTEARFELKDGLNLIEQVKQKETELKRLEQELAVFKAEMFNQLQAAGLENVRKEGYNFTIVKPQKTVIDDAIAWDLITKAGKLPERYSVIDKDLFMVDFGKENDAIKKVPGTPYLKISEVKK